MCDIDRENLADAIKALADKQENEHKAIDLLTSALLAMNDDLDYVADQNEILQEKIYALEEQLAHVSLSASKGESAWGMFQPLGGTR